jgi:hypothetical protein
MPLRPGAEQAKQPRAGLGDRRFERGIGGMGSSIVINPPGPLQESFNEVNQAQQQKEKAISEARRDYNELIPLTEGEREERIREADGYRLERINEARGNVARFSASLTEYSKAPEITRRRICIETLQVPRSFAYSVSSCSISASSGSTSTRACARRSAIE